MKKTAPPLLAMSVVLTMSLAACNQDEQASQAPEASQIASETKPDTSK